MLCFSFLKLGIFFAQNVIQGPKILLGRKGSFKKIAEIFRMYFFLLHLSIADILTAFSSLLPELVWTATSAPNFNGGDALCRILKFVQMVAPYLR